MYVLSQIISMYNSTQTGPIVTVSKLLYFHFLHITLIKMWLIKQSAACRSWFPNIRGEVIHTTDRSCSVSGLSLESLFFLEAGRALLSFSIEALAAETHNIVTHPYFCMAKQLIMPVSKYVYMRMLWGIQYWNLFIKKHTSSKLTGSIHFSQLHRLSIEPQSLSAIDFIF